MQLKTALNLFIIPSSVPVFEAAKGWAKSSLFIAVGRCLRQLKAGLNLFIIPSSGPVFEAAKGWAKSFHYF